MTADYLSYSLHSTDITSLSISLVFIKSSLIPHLNLLPSLKTVRFVAVGKYLSCLILSFLMYKMGIKWDTHPQGSQKYQTAFQTS